MQLRGRKGIFDEISTISEKETILIRINNLQKKLPINAKSDRIGQVFQIFHIFCSIKKPSERWQSG